MSKNDIYVKPKKVNNLRDCYFYHTMDVPGYGCINGEWDLRENTDRYLGGVNVKGKRVLEIGTADGFLCFYMEKGGAKVVAFDLSENQTWDIVPYSRCNYQKRVLETKNNCRKINNAYWFCHQAYKSRAKMVYGTVYRIPKEIGMVDITTFGCILLHVRDPFLALASTLKLTKEKVIITEPLQKWYSPLQLIGNYLSQMVFLPESKFCMPEDSWWSLSPKIIKQFLGVLGFEKTKVIYHFQKYFGRKHLLYTVVGQRTQKIKTP